MKHKIKMTVGKAMSVDESAFTLTAVMSTKSVDRDGDIVEPRGMKLDNFLPNPVVLWAHDKKSPPIGKVKEVFVSEDSIMGVIEFDKEDPFARLIFNKYAKGFLNAWSIGFSPNTKTLAPIMDAGGQVSGYNFKEAELLELSAVPVPANPEALVREMREEKSAELVARFSQGADEVLLKQLEDSIAQGSHTHQIEAKEPSWNSVDAATLPPVAFAGVGVGGDESQKALGTFPHHWVKDSATRPGSGSVAIGALLLHEGGLKKAWADVMALRDKAPAEVVAHLQAHRVAVGMDQVDRLKHHFARYSEGKVEVFREKATQDGSDLHEVTTLALAPNALKKSLDERGAKVSTACEIGEAAKIEVDFEVIQMGDGLIKEARVLQIHVTIPKSAVLPTSTPPGPDHASKETEESANDTVTPSEVDQKLVLEDLEMEMMGMAARVAAL